MVLVADAFEGEDFRRFDCRAVGVTVFRSGLGERARLSGVDVVALDIEEGRPRGMIEVANEAFRKL